MVVIGLEKLTGNIPNMGCGPQLSGAALGP